jgi:hypothetical protein
MDRAQQFAPRFFRQKIKEGALTGFLYPYRISLDRGVDLSLGRRPHQGKQRIHTGKGRFIDRVSRGFQLTAGIYLFQDAGSANGS